MYQFSQLCHKIGGCDPLVLALNPLSRTVLVFDNQHTAENQVEEFISEIGFCFAAQIFCPL